MLFQKQKSLVPYIFLCLAIAFNACSAQEPAKDASEYIKVIEKTENTLSLSFGNNTKSDIFVVLRNGAKAEPITKLPKFSYSESMSISTLAKISDSQSLVNFLKAGSNNKIVLNDLTPETRYQFDVYSSSGEKNSLLASSVISTLAIKPTNGSKQIAFGSVTENSMYVHFSPGNGKYQMLLAKEGATPDMPKDGVTYIASNNFSNAASKIPNTQTYVIAKQAFQTGGIKVEGLSSGANYHFLVVDFNGENGAESYFVDTTVNQNPRLKMSKLTTPVIKPNIKWNGNSIAISWSKVNGAEFYELAVATDEQMTKLLPEYENADIGLLTEYEIYINDPSKIYYFTLKAKAKANESEPSKAIQIKK